MDWITNWIVYYNIYSTKIAIIFVVLLSKSAYEKCRAPEKYCLQTFWGEEKPTANAQQIL